MRQFHRHHQLIEGEREERIMSIQRALRREKRKPLWRSRDAYLFILPGLGLFLFFFLYPIIYLARLSFTNVNFFNFVKGYEAIGLSNYQRLLWEGRFFAPLLRTLLFIVTSVPLKVFAGLFFAALFGSPYLKLKTLLRPLFLIPWAVPWFLLTLIWRWMFNQDFGGSIRCFI